MSQGNSMEETFEKSKDKNAKETLLKMGFSPQRADKALAATGSRGAIHAANWIAAHVNDPEIDSTAPRNFVLCLCPSGELSNQLKAFFNGSKEKFGWSSVHKVLPHIALLPEFQCPDSRVDELVNKVKRIVEQFSGKFSTSKMTLERHQWRPQWFGLFLNQDVNTLLRSLQSALIEAISSEETIGSSFKPPDGEPFHLTLADEIKSSDQMHVLEELLLAKVDLAKSSPENWELKLFSYEDRIKKSDVYEVMNTYDPKNENELELLKGDYIIAKSPITDGYLTGISWLTGCQGLVNQRHVVRTLRSDAWTINFETSLVTDALISPDVFTPRPLSLMLQSIKPSQPSFEKKGLDSRRNRRIYTCRHGERVDFTFGAWIPYCFNESGEYYRKDLNMPKTVPKKKAGPQGFFLDTPLTVLGKVQAQSTGTALKEAGVRVAHAYSSPSLRCVETCTEVLKAMGLADDIKINIEPGLFEFLGFFKDTMPDWFSPQEFQDQGFNIELSYKPFISARELEDSIRESCEEFYTRNYFVSQCIAQATEPKGGDILLSAHGASLDACTRQMIGRKPRVAQELLSIVRQTPYCSISVIEETGDGQDKGSGKKSAWKMIEPPIPCFTHGANARYDWTLIDRG